METEAQKRANKKWKSENMVSVSIRIRKDLMTRFKEKAAENNETIHSVIKAAIEEYVRE